MMTFGVISKLVVIASLLACVSGSTLVRNKRQWGTAIGDPYGRCGKPTTPIPHGGIKLFPVTDFDDPHDNSCYTGSSSLCEPKFYCYDGYAKKGDFHLDCVSDPSTGDYKWEGSIPTCEEIKVSRTFFYVIPGVILPLSLICSVIARALRNDRRNRATQPTRRTGVRSTTVHIRPSSGAPGRRTFGLPTVTRPPGYSRFDDSNVNVPQANATNQTGEVPTTEAVSNADHRPPYPKDATAVPTIPVATTEAISNGDTPPIYAQTCRIEPGSTIQ